MKAMRQQTENVIEIEDMGIPMPDGVRLSARVWMPEDAEARPVPAVLEYIPYRKRDGTVARDERMHPYVARHGYACVRVDIRGNGDSEGLMEDEYSPQELQDACEVIAWLAQQPWCSGSVGMMGKSWGGFNCLQTAFLQPPALKAVISVCATADRFADDIHFKGGCLLGENFGWGSVMLSYSSRPPDPALRTDWREDWLRRLEAQPFLAPRWAAHQARDAYWKHGSVCEDWSRMTVPILSVGGWADGYMNTVATLVEHAGAKGIVGPWVHQYPHQAVPGPAIGFLQEAVRWWDRWLRGAGNGVEADPAYRVWMQHSCPPDPCAAERPGHWVAMTTWPDPLARRRVLHLTAGEAGSLPGWRYPAGRLGDMPQSGLGMEISTPQHLGLMAGEYFPMGLNGEMPGDQAPDDALSLCFDGVAGDAPLDLLGAARVTLRLSSDRPLGFVVARLCDVAPDGSSLRIAHGLLNLCHRDSREDPKPMVAGELVDIAFDLDQMAHRLLPGHRLRLALSTTYWPFVWPSPEVARLTVESGRLELPVHGGSGKGWTPPPAESAPEWKHRILREGTSRRVVEQELIRGVRALVVEEDTGEVENLSHGLVTGETMRERWEIRPDDPLSAIAEQDWEQRLSRGDWSVRTRAWSRMTATATHLLHEARLTAWEADKQVFDRSYREEVPRNFV